jgi:hypothetical protein
MPPYLTHTETWEAVWPLPLAAVLIASSLYLIVMLVARPDDKRTLLLVLLAFSMLGIVTGYLTGLSREPAVGAVLPAVLSLIGGLAAALIGRDNASMAVVSIAVLAFSFSILISTGWGVRLRNIVEEDKISKNYLMHRAQIEAEVRAFRKALLLPEDDSYRNNK